MTGRPRAGGELGARRAPGRDAPVLPAERRPEEAGVVRRERDGDARREERAHGVRRARPNRARREIGRRADVADDAAAREKAQERGVLGGPDAVRDADGPEALERLGDGFGARPFARVRDGHQAEPPRAPERRGEIPRGEARFLASQPEPGGAPPRVLLVEVEDAVGRRGSPVAHGVEEHEDPSAARGFVRREDALEGRAHLEPVEAEPFGHGRRDVDLGVADTLARKARDEGARDEPIVGRGPDLPADVSVEGEESVRRAEARAPRADGREIRENGPGRAGGQAHERRRRDRALEVQMELDGGRGRETAEKRGGGRGEGHADGSYGVFETGPIPLAAPPRERLWMRAAAFGVDLLLVAGGPLLVASVIVGGVAAVAAEAPAGLNAGFRAAQALSVLLFLARDGAGGSPGKKLFGLRLIRPGGSPAGLEASLLRNLPLLVPGWNLVEVASVIRRRDGRRPGDKLAGTTLVEA